MIFFLLTIFIHYLPPPRPICMLTFPASCRTGFYKWKYDLNVLNQCVQNRIDLMGILPKRLTPPPPHCKNWPDPTRFFYPCQLGSTVEIRLWEWRELLNKNFHVYIFFYTNSTSTRFFSYVGELLAREHEIIRLAAFVQFSL